jgi:hypothetical protein
MIGVFMELDKMKNKLELADIEAKVKSVTYHVFPGTTTTVCLMTLQNGYLLLGESACVDPANFNEQTGQEWAYKNALDKVWKLEGYLLKEQLYVG